MKKIFIIFTLLLSTAFLGSCHKDEDNASTREAPSNTDGPAEDPGVMPASDSLNNGLEVIPEDHTSSDVKDKNSGQQSDSTISNRNRSSRENKDSVTR